MSVPTWSTRRLKQWLKWVSVAKLPKSGKMLPGVAEVSARPLNVWRVFSAFRRNTISSQEGKCKGLGTQLTQYEICMLSTYDNLQATVLISYKEVICATSESATSLSIACR